MAEKKKKISENPAVKKDYWDSIAEDVSSGYGANDVKRSSKKEEILNEDQEPDDEQRADT
jgi:hypothetical protein